MNKYNEYKGIITDLYIDYGLKVPINIFDLCKILNIKLISYSSLENEYRQIALKKSKDAFCSNKPGNFVIFFNDDINVVKSYGRIIYSIAHELKHIITQDVNDSNEEEHYANYFARYLICPICYLVAKKYPFDENIIMKEFNLSKQAAKNVINAYRSYFESSVGRCFKSDKKLLKQLLTEEEFEKVEFI